MDHLDRRERGRMNVTQSLVLRSEKDPSIFHHVISIDVSEENIGIETEANLTLGEQIRLELTTATKTVVVNAIVMRNIDNLYGCKFADDYDAKKINYFTHYVVRYFTSPKTMKCLLSLTLIASVVIIFVPILLNQ